MYIYTLPTYQITLLEPPPPIVCNYLILLIIFPLWLAVVIIFYFLSGYWLWKLINIFYLLWLYNCYSLNTIVSWLVNRKIIELYINKNESHSVVSSSLHPMNYTVLGILQARILESGSLSLLQGIFPTQGSNPGLPHCRRIFTSWGTREAQEYWSG